MNIPPIYLYMIIYVVCLFTLTVRYSVGLFVIQIEKVMNIPLIYLYMIIYVVCLFTLTVRYSNRKSYECCTNIFMHDYLCSLFIHSYSRYSVGQFVIQIVKVMNIALIY